MPPTLDLVITGGKLVDPGSGLTGEYDIGIRGGRIESIESGGALQRSLRCLDVQGATVMPGLVDAHVHVSKPFGRGAGLQMVAAAGVTSCLDLAGDGVSLVDALHAHGSGVNAAYVHPIIPGRNVSNASPTTEELEAVVAGALEEGALGIKILGGHYPLAPESIAEAIRIAGSMGAHVAVHCGSTETGSDIRGLAETIELAGDTAIQIAHINSYCRGQVHEDPMQEALEAVRMLAHANVSSESYLSLLNGTSTTCIGDVPESHVTRTCLRLAGYEDTRAGLNDAVAEGHAFVNLPLSHVTELITGPDALEHINYDRPGSVVSFPVNPPDVTSYLASAKRDGEFVVTALATDGGSIPRNSTVRQGLSLVKYGHMTLSEFVHKACVAPARMLGLQERGSLAPGSWADISVVDVDTAAPLYTFAAGVPVYVSGLVVGTSGKLLTTDRGVEFAQRSGVTHQVVRHVT